MSCFLFSCSLAFLGSTVFRVSWLGVIGSAQKSHLLSSIICILYIYSCNMGTSGLPDIYTQSTRAAGPRAGGVYIRQTTSAHVTTVMYHLFIGQKPT